MSGFILFMAWPLIVTSGAIAAGIVLRGTLEAKARWEALEAKKRRLEYLRETARAERETRLREQVTSLWNKEVDWND